MRRRHGEPGVNDDEERIALFLDYENLAIGARENLGGMSFDLKPISDAIAERGAKESVFCQQEGWFDDDDKESKR